MAEEDRIPATVGVHLALLVERVDPLSGQTSLVGEIGADLQPSLRVGLRGPERRRWLPLGDLLGMAGGGDHSRLRPDLVAHPTYRLREVVALGVGQPRDGSRPALLSGDGAPPLPVHV